MYYLASLWSWLAARTIGSLPDFFFPLIFLLQGLSWLQPRPLLYSPKQAERESLHVTNVFVTFEYLMRVKVDQLLVSSWRWNWNCCALSLILTQDSWQEPALSIIRPRPQACCAFFRRQLGVGGHIMRLLFREGFVKCEFHIDIHTSSLRLLFWFSIMSPIWTNAAKIWTSHHICSNRFVLFFGGVRLNIRAIWLSVGLQGSLFAFYEKGSQTFPEKPSDGVHHLIQLLLAWSLEEFFS